MTTNDYDVSLEDFRNWAIAKNPDQTYQTANNCKCPMADYAKEVHGFTMPRAGVVSVLDNAGPGYLKFETGVLGAICSDKTFGKLVEELQVYIDYRDRRIKKGDARN